MAYKVGKATPTSIDRNTSTEGETIETRIERLVENNEGIDEGVDMIYTERKDGVNAELNPRTDKFEVAIEATEKIGKGWKGNREYEAKMRLEKGGENENKDTKGESLQGKDGETTTEAK